MATQDRPSDEGSRNSTFSKLDMSRQFTVTKQIKDLEKASPEQLLDIAKDLVVHLAYKDQTYINLIKAGL